MWDSDVTRIDSSTLRYSITAAGSALSYLDVVNNWMDNNKFRTWFRQLLADVPYRAFFWETIAVTKASARNKFEFVAIKSDSLDSMNIDRYAFEEHFNTASQGSGTAEFSNIGGDAFLIAPVPQGTEAVYKHLATFMRDAPKQQADSMWQEVGESLSLRLGTKPLWVSTSGLGVGWLHIRIDTSPKYYQYEPYKNTN